MKRAALVLLAACGTDVDIPQPDGPFIPGPVSIEITQRGAPVVNVQVIFQNADSSVAAATVTDFDGKATAEIDGDGFVTVVEPREDGAPRDVLSTFAGVQGGDVLHLDLSRPAPVDVASFGLKLQEDTMTIPSGGYLLFTQCGPVEGGSLIEVTPVTLVGCGETADMLVVSLDEFGLPARGQFRSGLDVSTDHDFSASPETYKLFIPSMLQYRNIPAEVGFVGAYRAIATDEHRVIFDQTAGVQPDVSPDVEIQIPFEGGSIVLNSSNTVPLAGEVGAQIVTEWGPSNNSAYTLDLAEAMLPRFTELPVFELDRRTITWAEAPAETEPEVTRIHLVIHRPMIPTGATWEWRLVGPRTGASLTLPNLPVDAKSFNFNPGSIDIVSVQTLTTAKLPAGYDKVVRERGFEPFRDMRVGPSGRIVTQDLAEPEPVGDPEEL